MAVKQLGAAPSATTDAATKNYVDTGLWSRAKDFYAAVGGTFSPVFVPVGGNPQSSQTIHGMAVYLYAGETVTNVICCVTIAGAGTAPTALKLGVWSSAATPVCLAVTADLATDSRWTSGTGWKVNALSSAYVVPSSGIYYLAFWINGAFATTNMSLSVSVPNLGPSQPIGSNPRMLGTLKTGATTMAVADTGTYGSTGSVTALGWS
jgi:hypothetical protein